MSLSGFINKQKRNWAARKEPSAFGKVISYLESYQSHMVSRYQGTKAKACAMYVYYQSLLALLRESMIPIQSWHLLVYLKDSCPI